MKKFTLSIKFTLIFFAIVAVLFTTQLVSAADRLVIKDSNDNPTFFVEDNGRVTADFAGTQTAGDGLTTLINLNAFNETSGKTSDVGFLLENSRENFRWAFRTIETSRGFQATKLGTGGPELEIRSFDNDFKKASLVMGNGAKCTSNGQWVNASSRDYKENIQKITSTEALKTIESLQPVKYNFKRDSSKDLTVGFIAEDVPDLVATKDRKALSPLEIVAVLTKVVQEQQKAMADQKAAFQKAIDKQQTVIAKLSERINQLEKQ
jgi:hypothetical protein